MGYHHLIIDAAEADLGARADQIVTRRPGDGRILRQLPLEDVVSIFVFSFRCRVDGELLLQCAERRIPLVLCRGFIPRAVISAVSRSNNTTVFRRQLAMPTPLALSLWKRVIAAKVENQSRALRALAAPLAAQKLEATLRFRCTPATMEAVAARRFWRGFGVSLGHYGFVRDRTAPGLNAQLNFGYGILLARTLCALLQTGLDPALGLFHATRAGNVALAYDLMEPVRPLVDYAVAQLHVRGHHRCTREFRETLAKALVHSLDLPGACTMTATSYADALACSNSRRLKPWTFPHAIPWDGC